MTVIAVKDGIMAADSAEVAGSMVYRTVTPKIARLKDGTLVGCAGFAHDCVLFTRWAQEHGIDPLNPAKADLPFMGEGEYRVDALVLRPDGSVWRNGRGMLSFYPEMQPSAIGAGTATIVAEVAMRLGKSAEEAVALCCEMCVEIRGPVQVERVGVQPTDDLGPVRRFASNLQAQAVQAKGNAPWAT